MDSQEGLPKHQLLQEEIEMESNASQVTQSTQMQSKQQIRGEYSNGMITDNGLSGQIGKNLEKKQESIGEEQLILTIKKLSGEPLQIPFTNELKNLNIVALKQRAFPEQFANGYSIRFIYRGRLIADSEMLTNLEFVGHPVIHAQINPPNNPVVQQHNLQNGAQPLADIENQQNQFQGVIPPNQYQNFQALAAQMLQQPNPNAAPNAQQQQQQQQLLDNQQNYEIEGTTCDFWFGFFLVLFLDFVGMFAVFCCQYPKKTKKGAILGFIVKIFLKIIFFKGDEEYQDKTQY